MKTRTTVAMMALLLACLGCTENRQSSVSPSPSAASAVTATASSASANASAASSAAGEVAAPIAIDYYDAEDALRLMPAVAFVRFKTDAGTLYCGVGLCGEAAPDPRDREATFVQSHHTVKLTPKGAAVKVDATSDPSDDPTYFVEERRIAGEDAYVPGDGCLYVRQSGNALFPITKRYCIGTEGKLERKPQSEGTFPLAHTANFTDSMQIFETPGGKRVVDVVPENERIYVMAARVSKLDDGGDSFSWLHVRTTRNVVGWIPMPESMPQCDDVTGNQKKLCFFGD